MSQLPSDPENLIRRAEKLGAIPLSFAMAQRFANLGDALSPIIVSMVSGRRVVHASMESSSPRLTAVGTIIHGMTGGDVHVWGSGSSFYRNPASATDQKELFDPEEAADFSVYATRGPISGKLVGAENWQNEPVYGDPVWLLPRYYKPEIEKKWELGVILHLSELAERELVCSPKINFKRYVIPQHHAGSIKLINTLTEPSVEALKTKIDEVLSCRRIVSTSLHGMVLAECYRIPCLYFGTSEKQPGLKSLKLSENASIDLRLSDFYLGLGQDSLTCYFQRREAHTDWDDVIESIDNAWTPVNFDPSDLERVFPLRRRVTAPMPSDNAFDTELIKSCPTAHKSARVSEFLTNGLTRIGRVLPTFRGKPE